MFGPPWEIKYTGVRPVVAAAVVEVEVTMATLVAQDEVARESLFSMRCARLDRVPMSINGSIIVGGKKKQRIDISPARAKRCFRAEL